MGERRDRLGGWLAGRGRGGAVSLSPSLALCLSPSWLYLSYILDTKSAIVSKLFPSSVSYSSKLLNLRWESWESLIYRKSVRRTGGLVSGLAS